ncbi:MAG: hypothetical protein PW843_09655 [Azospirillaceae bacterium]|nr:hypothetical protein [Azospirillaceae bacterium]
MPFSRPLADHLPLPRLGLASACLVALLVGAAPAVAQVQPDPVNTSTMGPVKPESIKAGTAQADAAQARPVADEGPARPPVLDGPGLAAADGRDDGVITRPPEGGRWASRDEDDDCRASGSVTMGVGFGGGMVERGGGATLNYGEGGNPYRPCAGGIGFSLSVSQTTMSGHPRGGWGGGPYGSYGGYGPYGYGAYPYAAMPYDMPYSGINTPYGRWSYDDAMDSWFASRLRP